MLSFNQFNNENDIKEEHRNNHNNRNEIMTNTVINTLDLVGFLNYANFEKVWVQDDGEWYKFKFVKTEEDDNG